MSQRHEYQIIYEGGSPPPDYRRRGQPVGAETHIVDAGVAGEMFRAMRESYPPEGGAIELQRRAVGPWETVEWAVLPARADAEKELVIKVRLEGPRPSAPESVVAALNAIDRMAADKSLSPADRVGGIEMILDAVVEMVRATRKGLTPRADAGPPG